MYLFLFYLSFIFWLNYILFYIILAYRTWSIFLLNDHDNHDDDNDNDNISPFFFIRKEIITILDHIYAVLFIQAMFFAKNYTIDY